MKDEIKSKFFKWNRLKIQIHFSDRLVYFREKEIWWASLGVNIGYEQDGKNKNFERPILILKKFNKYVLLVVPITSKVKIGQYYYQFNYRGKDYSIILSQVRLISSKRLLRRIRVFKKIDFEIVKNKIKDFL